jgi:hypothetical protein
VRLRVVSQKNEIPNLNPNEKMVHLAFRASNVDFLNLMQRCPRLKTIQVPHSYQTTTSNAIQVFLDMQGIELLEGDIWGHRKDLDEYYTVEDATGEEIRTLAASGATADDVANQIQNRTRLSPDLIKYIAKTKITLESDSLGQHIETGSSSFQHLFQSFRAFDGLAEFTSGRSCLDKKRNLHIA